MRIQKWMLGKPKTYKQTKEREFRNLDEARERGRRQQGTQEAEGRSTAVRAERSQRETQKEGEKVAAQQCGPQQ